MSNKQKRKLINLGANLVIIVIVAIFLSFTGEDKTLIVTLDMCVDGDTAKFFTDEGSKTVRFLAIDTPESVHPTKEVEPYGIEASTFTCNELKKAKSIVLELDNSSDKYDKYNRMLAWVFVDDILLQKKIIEIGYAKVAYLYGDYKYTDILRAEEAESHEKGLGIWYNGG